MYALTADESPEARLEIIKHSFDGMYSVIRNEQADEILEAIFNR